MTVSLPHVFATQSAATAVPASFFDDNFNACVNGINAITVTQGIAINAQTGTTYTVLSGDLGKYLTFSNSGAIAVTLPNATGLFAAPWFAYFSCLKASTGAVTITPNTANIDGAATLVLQPGQSAIVVSDSTNYQIQRGMTPFSKSFTSGIQTITSAGALTLAHGGLSISPRLPLLQVFLTCTTGENTFNIGDKLVVPNGIISDGTASRGCETVIDATNLNVRFGTATACFMAGDRGSGAIVGLTNANWNATFEAWS